MWMPAVNPVWMGDTVIFPAAYVLHVRSNDKSLQKIVLQVWSMNKFSLNMNIKKRIFSLTSSGI